MHSHRFYSNLLIVFLLLAANGMAGQVIYGTNSYIEYHVGTLPVVISVPHGGLLSPSDLPDRTCNNPVLATDTNTQELAKEIDSTFVRLTGCHPHIVYCNLRRTKIDCNRTLADGACGNADAETAWKEFHQFIDTAQLLARAAYDDKVFYFDLHGHGHIIQRLELGYLLSGDELGLSDNVLNTPGYVSNSSIQNLAGQNLNGYTHAELLRGEYALGTMLAEAGYPTVPSQQTPDPGPLNPYFNGGYNTANHTCFKPGNPVNGLQLECNYANVRDLAINRRAFADALVPALLAFLNHHQGISVENCGVSGQGSPERGKKPSIYPNLLDPNTPIRIKDADLTGYTFRVFAITGQLIAAGKVKPDNTIAVNGNFSQGLYVLVVEQERHRYVWKVCAGF